MPPKYIEGVLEALIFAEFHVLFKNVMQGEECVQNCLLLSSLVLTKTNRKKQRSTKEDI